MPFAPQESAIESLQAILNHEISLVVDVLCTGKRFKHAVSCNLIGLLIDGSILRTLIGQ